MFDKTASVSSQLVDDKQVTSGCLTLSTNLICTIETPIAKLAPFKIIKNTNNEWEIVKPKHSVSSKLKVSSEEGYFKKKQQVARGNRFNVLNDQGETVNVYVNSVSGAWKRSNQKITSHSVKNSSSVRINLFQTLKIGT